MRTRRETLTADAALVLVTLIWGTTFPLTKQLLTRLPAYSYAALRFGLAAVALTLVAGPRMLRLTRRDWGAASVIAVPLVLGLVFQWLGLRTTTATKSAFLTSVSAVLVPVAATWILKTRPPLAAWIGCALAGVGVALLTWTPGLRIGRGDLLTMVTAVVFALEIVLVSKFFPGRDARALTAALAIVSALLVLPLPFLFHEPPLHFSTIPWPATLWLGVVAGGASLLIQNAAQQHTPAAHAAVIFTLEPLWAALFAFAWQGEVLATRGWLGGACILLAIVVAELAP